MLLLAVFLVTLVISFSIFALFARKTGSEKAFEQRVSSLGLRAESRQPDSRHTDTLLKPSSTSAFPQLDKLLSRGRAGAALAKLLEQSGSRWTPATFCLSSLGAGLVLFTAGYIFFPAIGVDVMLGALAAGAPWMYLKHACSKRIANFDHGLADAIDLMARALRAGHSLNSAIEVLSEQASGPVAAEFQRVFQQQNFGLPLREALLEMAAHIPSQDLRFLVTAMLVQKETGGNLTEILDRAAYVIRERVRIQGEIRVRTAQGRMTGWILSLLPVVLLILLNLVNPGYSGSLLHTATGQKLLYTGAGLIAIGAFVMRKVVDIEV